MLDKLIQTLSNDKVFVELIQQMIIDATRYIQSVIEHESQKNTGRYILDPDEYRQHIADLDKSRSTRHNSLIASVAVVNRLCTKSGFDPIYKGNPEDRVAIGDFAFELVAGIFSNRIR